METKIKTVFICESCKKKMFYKKSMEKHEQYCLENKENIPACFKNCKFFENNAKIRDGSYYGFSEYRFFCHKMEEPLHTKKAVIQNNTLITSCSYLMPKSCQSFKKSEIPF